MDTRLVRVVSSVLRIDPGAVVASLAMDDLDAWDSLKHMELIAGIEEAFSVQFSFDDIVAMRTVGAIERILRERGCIT